MNTLEKDNVIKLIKRKTNNILKKYKDIKVSLNEDYYNFILDEIKDNLKDIDLVINKKIENKVIDALLESKKHINITV